MQNRTAYLIADGKFEIKDSPMPTVGIDDLLIQINHVGICGSDLAFFKDVTLDGILQANYPVVLGHECAGTVMGVGENVKGFFIGDRVAVEPGVPCMKCGYCLKGKYNLCDHMNFMACPPWELAALQRYIAHPAMMCFKLPDHVSTLEGALVEPLAVGMHAATKAGIEPGKSVLIIGSGCIGLTTLIACKARGASTVYVADLYDNRLEMAKAFGAKEAINSGKIDLVERISELTEGRGVDVVFEAAGSVKTAAMTLKLVKKGGKITMVGNIHGDVPFDFMAVGSNEVDVIGTFRYRNLYPMLIESISAGTIDVKGICTDLYKFEDVQRGFEDASQRKMQVLKAVVEM
ncbi:MAG: NAD(P)-dependent alcohol dehydrogenase [Christensenellales bacterium]|jgi:L-iditol 2-dehydrogenase